MIRYILLLNLALTFFSTDAQTLKIEHLQKGDFPHRLIEGRDYYVHTNGQANVVLYGKCNELTLELDGQSEIVFRNLQVTRDLTVQSINGASHIRDEVGSYPKDTIYLAQNFTVRHMDNPASYISLKHLSFNFASLAYNDPTSSGRLEIGKNEDGTPLFVIPLPHWIDPASINGGGILNLVVRSAAFGLLQGHTVIRFFRDCHPNVSKLLTDAGCTVFVPAHE